MHMPPAMTKKLAGVPVWGWMVAAGFAIAIGLYIRHKSVATNTAGTDASTLDGMTNALAGGTPANAPTGLDPALADLLANAQAALASGVGDVGAFPDGSGGFGDPGVDGSGGDGGNTGDGGSGAGKSSSTSGTLGPSARGYDALRLYAAAHPLPASTWSQFSAAYRGTGDPRGTLNAFAGWSPGSGGAPLASGFGGAAQEKTPGAAPGVWPAGGGATPLRATAAPSNRGPSTPRRATTTLARLRRVGVGSRGPRRTTRWIQPTAFGMAPQTK